METRFAAPGVSSFPSLFFFFRRTQKQFLMGLPVENPANFAKGLWTTFPPFRPSFSLFFSSFSPLALDQSLDGQRKTKEDFHLISKRNFSFQHSSSFPFFPTRRTLSVAKKVSYRALAWSPLLSVPLFSFFSFLFFPGYYDSHPQGE